MAVTPDNAKFHSLGTAKQQEADRALVCKLCGEIGVDGYELLDSRDRVFIDDIRYKLQTAHRMFGTRQVKYIQEVVEKVREVRRAQQA